eukprot:Awhi_evm2s11263
MVDPLLLKKRGFCKIKKFKSKIRTKTYKICSVHLNNVLDKQTVIIQVEIDGVHRIRALLDTGANVSCIDKKFIEKIKCKYKPTNHVEVELANGDIVKPEGVLTETMTVDTGRAIINNKPLVIDLSQDREKNDVDFEMIICLQDMNKLGMHISNIPPPNALDMRGEVDDNMLLSDTNVNEKPLFPYELESYIRDFLKENSMVDINKWTNLPNSEVDVQIDDELLKKVKFPNKNYVNFKHEQVTTDTIAKWLNDGILQICDFQTPVNLALLAVAQYKPDGSLKKVRVCVDFRPINPLIPMDRVQIPSCSELTKKMQGYKVYSTLDLKSGYNQMKIKPASRKYFTFTWKGTQYCFKGAPFGLHFLPSKFHRMVSHLLRDLPGVVVYIDDICIGSMSIEQHKKIVAEVIKRLTDANLCLNEEKCYFGLPAVNFLGFRISVNGVEVDPERQKHLLQIPVPRTGADLRSFLGSMNFLRDYLPYYGEIAGVLHSLVNVTGLLEDNEDWINGGLDAFNSIIEMLQSPKCLQAPLDNVPFHLETDASVFGFGGVLYQIDTRYDENDFRRKRIIQFFSGSFKKAQSKYTIPKKELFAIIYALRHLRYYLKGAHFHLYTDNRSLSYLFTNELDKSAIGQWFEILSSFCFTITHIPRETNEIADHMSKMCKDSVIHKWRQKQMVHLSTDEKNQFANVDKINFEKLPETYRVKAMNYKSKLKNRRKGTSDWKLNHRFFAIAEEKYGPHTIDLMASKKNAQLSRYMTVSTDAFSIDWKDENGWCNPPWHLIPMVLDYVKTTKSTITVCVPLYFQAEWFNTWKSMLIDEPIVLPNCSDTFLKNGDQIVGETPWGLSMISRISFESKFELSDSFFTNIKVKTKFNINAYNLRDRSKLGHSRDVPESENSNAADLLLAHKGPVAKSVSSVESNDSETDSPAESAREIEPHVHLVDDLGNHSTTINRYDRSNVDGCTVVSNVEKLDSLNRGINGLSSAIVDDMTLDERLLIVQAYHNLTHSHKGDVRTMMKKDGLYKWKDLSQLVNYIDNTCLHCELNSIEKTGYHPLASIHSEFVGDTWVVDLILLPKKNSKDDVYVVLHVLDLFSGFNILRLCADKSMKTIANELHLIMCDHGCPTKIIHDKGNEFLNSLVTELCSTVAKIVMTGGSPYHPQTQGSNERRHKIIRDLIKSMLSDYVDNWDLAIPTVQMKMNLRIYRKHGSTPFAVYYGRRHNLLNLSRDARKTSDSWFDVLDRMDNVINPALRKRAKVYHNRLLESFNSRNRNRLVEYEIGSLVKMKNISSSGTKLDNDWKGPYYIKERVQGGYNLIDVNSETGTIINIHPVPPTQLALWRRFDAINSKSVAFEFKRIIDHRVELGVKQYQILWSDNTTTWEYPNAFTDMSVIRRYSQLVKKREQDALKKAKFARKKPTVKANSKRVRSVCD